MKQKTRQWVVSKEGKIVDKKKISKRTIIGNYGPRVSLQDALKKERIVRLVKSKDSGDYGRICLPQVLIGHKVRIVLCQNSNKKEE